MEKLLIIIFLFSYSVFSQEKQNDLNKYGLKGTVKSLNQIKYFAIEIDDSTVIKGPKKIHDRFYYQNDILTYFNNSGYLIEIKDNNKHEKYFYNEKNKIIRTEMLDSNSNIFRKINYKYDQKNQLKKEFWIDSKNEIDYKVLLKYKNGKIVSKIEKDLDWKEKYLLKYKYDKNNYLIKFEEYENDSLTSKILFENDSLGRVIKIEKYNSENILNNTIKNQYNKFGIKTTTSRFNSYDKLISKIEYSYDVDLNLIEVYELLEGYSKYIQYNKMGNIILSVNQNYNDDIYEYIYSYDENLNWIKTIIYYNGEAYSIEEREILYY